MIERGPRIVRRSALALSLVVPAVAAASGAFEGGIGAGTSWYDHRSSTAASYNMRTLKPYLRYDGAAGSWGLRASAQRRYEMYAGDAIDSVLHTSRHTHDRFTASAERRFSASDRLGIEGGYVRSHDLLEADQGTVVVDGNVTRWTGALGTRISWFEGAARLRTTSYEASSGYAPSGAVAWSARFLPLRHPEQSAFVGVATTQLDLGHATALIQRTATAGYRRHVLPLIQLELEAGAAETRFADGARQTRPLFGIGIERDPGRGSALALALHARAEGDSLATLSGEARWRLASGRLWLRGESLADAEGGLYRSPTLTRRIAVGVEDTLGRANLVGIETSYIRTRPLRGAGEGTEILRSSAWAMRRIQPWLNARIGASYLREPIGRPRSGPVFRRIRLDAELIVLHGGFGTSTFKGPTGERPGRAG